MMIIILYFSIWITIVLNECVTLYTRDMNVTLSDRRALIRSESPACYCKEVRIGKCHYGLSDI